MPAEVTVPLAISPSPMVALTPLARAGAADQRRTSAHNARRCSAREIVLTNCKALPLLYQSKTRKPWAQIPAASAYFFLLRPEPGFADSSPGTGGGALLHNNE